MIVRELITKLGFSTDEAAIGRYDKAMMGLQKTIVGVTAAAGAAGAALLGIITVQNRATEQATNMAKAYGISAEEFEAWGAVMESAGLNAENAGDLVEEMTNKIGEMKALGEMTAVEDSFAGMGLSFAEIDKLSPEQQFRKIMDQLERMPDAQQAASMADMLFGGEANKVVTLLRNTEGSVADIIDRQKQLNLLTNEGREGASEYSSAFRDATKVISSGVAQISGLLGSKLAPQLRELTDRFIQWYNLNKDLIQQRLERAIEVISGALRIFWVALTRTLSIVDDIVQRFGGWEQVIKLVGIAIVSLIGVRAVQAIISMTTAVKSLSAAMWLNPVGLIVAGVIALITVIGLVIEDIYHWINGNESLFGQMFGAFDQLSARAQDTWLKVKENLLDPLADAFVGIKDIVVGALTLDWDQVKHGFMRLAGGMIMWARNMAGTIKDIILSILPTWMVEALQSAGGAISGAADKIKSGFAALNPFSSSPAESMAPAMAGGGSMVMNADVSISVPEGTSQEQALAIDRQVRDSMGRMMASARQNVVVAE